MSKAPDIGTHLLSLNMFRESDGSVQITVAGHSPAFMKEYEEAVKEVAYKNPHAYAIELVAEYVYGLGRK